MFRHYLGVIKKSAYVQMVPVHTSSYYLQSTSGQKAYDDECSYFQNALPAIPSDPKPNIAL
jgi:hypothetical protein